MRSVETPQGIDYSVPITTQPPDCAVVCAPWSNQFDVEKNQPLDARGKPDLEAKAQYDLAAKAGPYRR